MLIAETPVWPNFFLMNVFFALKGSKLFIINIYSYIKIKFIMQTSPCNEYPLTPNFYIVKLGFTGVNLIFLFLP